jgi:hypothetical protein
MSLFIKGCQKADRLLDNLYRPFEKLTKIIVQLFVIIGIILFVISPSFDNTVLLIPLLMSIMGKSKLGT